MSADVAMTKKGFGEMAITGTMAGPIFNVLMGMGLSMVLKFASSSNPFTSNVNVSIYLENGEFAKNAVLPLGLIVGQLVVLLVLLVNALLKNFNVTRMFTFINGGIYTVVTLGLVIFSIATPAETED